MELRLSFHNHGTGELVSRINWSGAASKSGVAVCILAAARSADRLRETIAGKCRLEAGAVIQSWDELCLHALQAWANHERAPRLIVDTDLRLRWSNDAARTLLVSSKIINVARGKLTFADDENRLTFRNLVRDAFTAPTSVSLDRGSPANRIVAVATALPVGGIRLVGVRLRLPHPANPPDGILRTVFALTNAECELVGFLLRGLTAEQAARRMEITVMTARTHIRNLYAKLNVSSREAMFSRLLPYLDN